MKYVYILCVLWFVALKQAEGARGGNGNHHNYNNYNRRGGGGGGGGGDLLGLGSLLNLGGGQMAQNKPQMQSQTSMPSENSKPQQNTGLLSSTLTGTGNALLGLLGTSGKPTETGYTGDKLTATDIYNLGGYTPSSTDFLQGNKDADILTQELQTGSNRYSEPVGVENNGNGNKGNNGNSGNKGNNGNNGNNGNKENNGNKGNGGNKNKNKDDANEDKTNNETDQNKGPIFLDPSQRQVKPLVPLDAWCYPCY